MSVRIHIRECPKYFESWVKHNPMPIRNPADYGYPSPDLAALSAKALEVRTFSYLTVREMSKLLPPGITF